MKTHHLFMQFAAALAAVVLSQNATAASAPTFDPAQTVTTAPRAANMVMGDFDGDGIPDVAVLDSNNGAVEVHFGDGAGGFDSTAASFTVPTSNSRHDGIAAADIDGDDQWELLFAAGNAVSIYEWSGTAFTPKTVKVNGTDVTSISLSASGIIATKVAVGDLTAAESRDIVVSDDFGNKGLVWIANDGTGTFTTPTTKAAGGCNTYAKPILADVDGDGLDDVVLSHSKFDSVSGKFVGVVGVLLNNGDGTLADEDFYKNSTFPTLQTRGVAVADVDGDGHPDLVTVASVTDPNQTTNNTFYLNVNLSNANGTFADGKAFQFQRNSGLNMIQSAVIDAADVNGDGRVDIVTLTQAGGANTFFGFTVTQWKGTGAAAFDMASQDDFATNFVSYQSIALGYKMNDGTFVTFNEDPQVDVLVGTTAQFQSPAPPHSQFLVFPNTTPAIPTGRNIEFARTNLNVSEGGELDVTLFRGSDGTGQVTAIFSIGGTAILQGYEAKGQAADYTITVPPNMTQAVVFAADDPNNPGHPEFIKTIHISTFPGKKSESVQSIVLTLLTPVGDADIGAKSTATIAIIDDQAASLKVGSLKVMPSNLVAKPFPVNIPPEVKVAGRTGSDWTFSVSQPFPEDAFEPAVKVQWSPNMAVWFDTGLVLARGKGSAWSGVTRYSLVPPLASCSKAFFRTVASAEGYPDVMSKPTPPFAVVAGPELSLKIAAKSDSDLSGRTTHTNEVITYEFTASNKSSVVGPTPATANPVVLTVPIPAHTTFLSATNIFGPYVEIKDHGVTKSVSWTFASLANAASAVENLLVQVDVADQFAKEKKHPDGIGYVIAEGTAKSPCTLSAPTQGVRLLGTEFETNILGGLKLLVDVTTTPASPMGGPLTARPGDLITYNFTCENDLPQAIVDSLVNFNIPEGTTLAQLYSFVSGNADTYSPPLPNPGALTNPAIIFARVPNKTKIDILNFFGPAPTVEQQVSVLKLLKPVLEPKPGPKIAQDDLRLLQALDNPTPAVDRIRLLINGGFITPAAVMWKMHDGIPANASRNVSVTVQVPFDAPLTDQNGNPRQIFDGTFDEKTGAFVAGYDFTYSDLTAAVSAINGDPQPNHAVSINRTTPPSSDRPHLVMAKSARGDRNLNNPNFHGNGFSTGRQHGNLVSAVEGRGVDYVLTYRNDVDGNGHGANATNVVLHDVIPVGMALKGNFRQVLGDNPQTSGPLVVGYDYRIVNYVAGDDFSNVAENGSAETNNTDITFKATGTTPANWSHASALLALVPMDPSQIVFFNQNGTIIPGIDPSKGVVPNSGIDDYTEVRSMDIRLGPVANLTTVPKNSSGFVEYTCSPTIAATTPYKQVKGRVVEFAPFPGTIHSFGGKSRDPKVGPSNPAQGFYITADGLGSLNVYPDNLVVQVVSDVSFSSVKVENSVGLVYPYDVAPVDFSFNQNGEVSATNCTLTFTVPTGVTLLNSATFLPRDASNNPLMAPASPPATPPASEHPSVTLDKDTHYKTNGVATFDVRPILINNLTGPPTVSGVGVTQTGNNVTLTLGTIDGSPGLENSYTVRVFFQVNGPHLDPAIVANKFAYEPSDAKAHGEYQGASALRFGRFAVTKTGAGTAINTATSEIAVHNAQRAAEFTSPHLGISRFAQSPVSKNSIFPVKITVSNHGSFPATGVHVGMQVPFGTYYAGVSTGLITSTVSSNATATPTAPVSILKTRQKDIADQTGGGPDILDWSIDALPANSDFTVNVLLHCDTRFTNYLVRDHSAFASAGNAGAIHTDDVELPVWISDSTTDGVVNADQIAQAYFDKNGFTLTPSFSLHTSGFAKHLELTTLPQVHTFAGEDLLQLPDSGVKIVPLGNNQVKVVASGGGNIVSHDGGTLSNGNTYDRTLVLPNGEKLHWNAAKVISNDGGSVVAAGGGNIVSRDGAGIVSRDGAGIVASGGGNFIELTDVPNGIGTQTCASLLDNAANVVAQGGGNVVAAGGGNLVSTNGGNLISNLDGHYLGAIGQITNALVLADAGRVFIGTKGNAIAAGLINQDGSSLIGQGGAAVHSLDAAGITSILSSAPGILNQDNASFSGH